MLAGDTHGLEQSSGIMNPMLVGHTHGPEQST